MICMRKLHLKIILKKHSYLEQIICKGISPWINSLKSEKKIVSIMYHSLMICYLVTVNKLSMKSV